MSLLRLLVVAGSLGLPAVAFAQDVVTLKSGEVVNGEVIGENESAVTLRRDDGSTRTFGRRDVSRIDLAGKEAPGLAEAEPQESHPGRGMLIGGLVTWISGYVVGVVATGVISATTGGDVGIAVGTASVPLVGPWIGFPVSAATDGHLTPGMVAGIIIDGVVQGVGFTVFIVGAATKSPDAGKKAADQGPSLRLAPMFDGSTLGGTIVGKY